MNAFVLVYAGTSQPVEVGDIFYVEGKAHTYKGDWDVLDVGVPALYTIVDTDKGMIEAHHIGVELIYTGAQA
jgi:hypothetical protein